MTRIDILTNQIKEGIFEYNVEFVGYVCSCCASEGKNGMYYSVYLDADNKENKAYANHIIRSGEELITCREYINKQRKWYMNEKAIDNCLFNDLDRIFDSIIKPFDFEKYAIEHFDYDAVSESIPYGDPYCLIISGCVFMIENGGDDYTEDDVRRLLKSYNWSKEEIDNAITEGYEFTPDVWETMNDLPVVYEMPHGIVS